MENPNVTFIYCRNDKKAEPVVKQTIQVLRNMGYKTFDIHNLLPGQDIFEATFAKLNASRHVIIFFSQMFFAESGLHWKALNTAYNIWERKSPDCRYIVPVQIDDCRMSYLKGIFRKIDPLDISETMDTGDILMTIGQPAKNQSQNEKNDTGQPKITHPTAAIIYCRDDTRAIQISEILSAVLRANGASAFDFQKDYSQKDSINQIPRILDDAAHVFVLFSRFFRNKGWHNELLTEARDSQRKRPLKSNFFVPVFLEDFDELRRMIDFSGRWVWKLSGKTLDEIAEEARIVIPSILRNYREPPPPSLL